MWFLRKRRQRILSDVRTRLGEENVAIVDESALFFGLESKGAAQVRGNGCLAASSDEVLFVMWVGKREFLIPRHRITAIERTKSHLGKRIGRELLKVNFTNDEGNSDSIAWYVRDLDAWEAALGA